MDFLSLSNRTSAVAEGLGETLANGGYIIDLPQIQGAVYAETCVSCLVNFEEPSEGCDFCSAIDYTSIEITNNTFSDNQDGFQAYEV